MIQAARRALAVAACFVAVATCDFAQTSSAPVETRATQPDAAQAAGDAASAATLDEVRKQLREQRAEIDQLRAALAEQTRLLNELLARSTGNAARTDAANAPAAPARAATVTGAVYSTTDMTTTDTPRAPGASVQTATTKQAQPETLEARVSRIEAQTKKTGESIARQLGAITFSGDLRFRYEAQFGQLNAQANAADPLLLGNELSPRHRLRLRARLAVRGQIGSRFDWGLRFSTGTLPDVASPNQTLTDFFSHKQFALDQAFISIRPAVLPGLRVQAGKFEIPWMFTEMTIDQDIQPEGVNESYTRDFKHDVVKNLTLVAWQLPMLERQAAFVLGADGRVNLDASRRGGRDLALYGAQARTRLALGKKSALTLSVADLYYSGTQFITTAQFIGGQLQVPVTVTIPATGTTPARTVAGFAAVPRELLVSGSALGLSAANTNAVNSDGRLSSGYNLVDFISRLDLTHSQRFPVTLIFNFVTNTQVHDVVAAGAGGMSRIIPNDERHGYWAEIQAGKSRARGDLLFGYTFVRIEKDAVLTPFNFSDILQPSDIRAHRMAFTYTADPRVVFSLIGIVNQRPHGLGGAFGTTPPGSLNRPTTRIQFDTVFRF